MRMLMNVLFPVEPFNTMVRDGTVGATMKEIMEAVRPESAHFVEQDGMRSALMIVNVNESSEIPALAEPFFLKFDAEVQFRIAMTVEDLQRAGLEELGRRWG